MGEQTAEFKAMGDGDKAAKKDTKKSAKKFNYKSPFASKSKDQPVIDCDPLSFAVKNNKSAAGKKIISVALRYPILLPHFFDSHHTLFL